MSGLLNRIPNFVKARKADALRVLMYEAQARTGFEYDWKIIWVESEKLWYGWFSEPSKINLIDGTIEKGNS